MGSAAGMMANARVPTLFARRVWLRRSFLLVLLCASAMCFAGIFQHGLWTPDEPREAEIGREMLASGWSAQPTLGGEPFLEKPPLFPWIMAGSYALFGVSPGAARLPAALFSIGAILVAYWMGRRAGGRSAGVFSALVMSTLAGFAQVSHSSVNDTALVFFVAFGQLTLLQAHDRQRMGESSPVLIVTGVCAGLAFLTKGFIGPVLLVGPPLLAAAVGREWSFLRFVLPRAALWCTVFVVLLGLPWVLALAHSGGWLAVQECLFNNTVGRSVSDLRPDYGHAHGFLYYLQAFPVDVLPWTLAIPAISLSGSLASDWRAGRARYLGWCVLAALVLLSLPATKRGLYMLPLYPAGSALVGTWLSRIGSARGGRLDRATLMSLTVLVGSVFVVVGVALIYLAIYRVLPEIEVGALRLSIVATLALALGVLALAQSGTSRSPRTRALATAGSVYAAFLFHQALLTPFLDPFKDLRRGAIAITQAVPSDEELFGLALDETTRAIVPFYSGRLIHNLRTPEQAALELDSGRVRHLVVTDGGRARIDEGLQSRLELATTIKLNATRSVYLYRSTKTP